MQTAIFELIETAGFTPLGWFEPLAEHDVPSFPDGARPGTVILLGNAGPAMWRRFSAEQRPGPNPMDDWTRMAVHGLVHRLEGICTTRIVAVFPFDQPYQPFQRWARAAGNAFPSPLGLTIHAVYGLWHAYRAALILERRLDLPGPGATASPCNSCRDTPCLMACPAGAFTGAAYDLHACASYLSRGEGKACFAGCLSRHACPVGREFAYEPEQARYHMAFFHDAHKTTEDHHDR